MAKINFNYAPRKAQRVILEDTKQNRVIVAHRRFGKTHHCLKELLIDGMNTLKKPGHVTLGYLAPTFTQAKRIAWSILKEFTQDFPKDPKGTWCAKWNEGELKFTFGAASSSFTIYLLGADNYDGLRGMGLYRVVFDEFADMNSKVWTEVVKPMLLDYPDSRATFIGTPKGRNKFFELYQAAKTLPGWSAHKFDLYNSGVYPYDKDIGMTKDKREALLDSGKPCPRTIEGIEEEYAQDPEGFNQEYKLSWQPSVKGAIYLPQITAVRNTGRVKPLVIDNRVNVNTAWDLGVRDENTIIFYQMVGDEVRIVDSYSNNNKEMAHYVSYVKQWQQNHGIAYDRHFLPHDIEVREYVTGSRRESMIQLGLIPTVVPKIGVDEGINAVRQLLPRCTFKSETTEDLLESLSQYRREYDNKNEVYKAKPVHDKHSHFADAMRYLAVSLPNFTGIHHAVSEGGDKWQP